MDRQRTHVQPSLESNRPTRVHGPAQNGKGYAANGFRTDWHPHASNPADKCDPKAAQNGEQEQGNPSRSSLEVWEQVVSRMGVTGEIAREANAIGKADGYADAGTSAWKIGL